jgi:hypothetical protein
MESNLRVLVAGDLDPLSVKFHTYDVEAVCSQPCTECSISGTQVQYAVGAKPVESEKYRRREIRARGRWRIRSPAVVLDRVRHVVTPCK